MTKHTAKECTVPTKASQPKNMAKTTLTKARGKQKRKDGLKKTAKYPSRRAIIRAPRSTWICYLSQVRAKELDEHKNLSFGGLCQLLSPVWAGMSDADKQPFHEEYVQDRLRFTKELSELTKEQRAALKYHKRRRKISREDQPKPSLSAYMIFVSRVRAQVIADSPGISFREVGRSLGKKWRELDDVDKRVFVDAATEARVEYIARLAEYKLNKKQLREKKRGRKVATESVKILDQPLANYL